MHHKSHSATLVVVTWMLALSLAGLFSAPNVAVAAGSGGGTGGGFPSTSVKPKTPEQQAASSYRSAIRHKERAWRYEAKAAKAAEAGKAKKQQSLLAKAKREYTKARAKQSAVLQIEPRNHEAANELGYALRKLGDYQKALGAYNYALELEPNFLPAIEYRGEAFLALGFVSETKAAYMRLFREDSTLAAQLMDAIQQWLGKQDASAEDIQDFARWAEERQRLVSFSSSAKPNPRWQTES